MSAPDIHEELTLRIERLAASGDGVAHDATGRVVFVPASCPGDRARVRITERHRSFARAELLEVLQAGAERVAPRCPYVGVCGGCAWQHLSYTQQCRAKAQRVRDAFARIAGVRAEHAPLLFHECPAPFGYRARARLGFRDGVVGYRRARSHTLCAVSSCAVLTPELDAALAELSKHPPAGRGELTLMAGDAGGDVSVSGDGRRGRAIALAACGERVRVSAGGFCQANAPLREALVRAVCDAAGEGARLLEFFAGSGYFTLALARRFGKVLAIEVQGRATNDLRANLKAAGASHVQVATGRAELELEGARVSAFRPDVVVLDPTRKGLAEAACERLAALAPARIVYLACDPATQARDCRRLLARGYRLQALSAFDLFPQTPHVESLALLVH